MSKGPDAGFDVSINRIFNVVKRTPNAGWKLELKGSPCNYVLCMALQGEAVYHLSGEQARELRVSGGDVLLFGPETPRFAHSVPENPWSFITVNFSITFPDEQTRTQLAELPMVARQTPGAVRTLFQELESTWVGKQSAYLLKCRALLEQIIWELIQLADASKVDSAHYLAIERVRQHIQEHYAESFTVEELAAMTRCSPSHFRMLFRQIVGMTTVQYQAMVRIEKAKDLLLSGEMNVSEAAAHLGYRDIYYFSRQFKQLTGKPPREYVR